MAATASVMRGCLGVGVVLQHHQSHQRPGPHAIVLGRLGFEELDRLLDGLLDRRALGRQGQGTRPPEPPAKQ